MEFSEFFPLLQFAYIDCVVKLQNNDEDSVDFVLSKLDFVLEGLERCTTNRTLCAEISAMTELAIHMLEDQLLELQRGRGRPRIAIKRHVLEGLVELRFSQASISQMLGVHVNTIHARMQELGLSSHQSYSEISENELQVAVLGILNELPNTGYKRMEGYLRIKNIRVQRERLRQAMRLVDPIGILLRRHENRLVSRRQYFVNYSNELWHIDTNLKLIRWKIVIRGGIDGKSRTCVYLDCGGDNTAASHLKSFMKGVNDFGIPSRCRSDKGGENVLIAEFMLANRGLGRGSHICGRSVHNQRIERFWRDVTYGCSAHYRNIFFQMEDMGWLNVENSIHMSLLHFIFLPRMQMHLELFASGWNRHPIRTDGNKSPLQLMLQHLPPQENDMIMSRNVLDYAEHLVETYDDLSLMNEETVLCPFPTNSLSDSQRERLRMINPLRQSDSYGCDIFIEALSVLRVSYLQ